MKIDKHGLTAVLIAISLMAAGCGAKATGSEPEGAMETGVSETAATPEATGASGDQTQRDNGAVNEDHTDGSEGEAVKGAMIPVHGDEIKDGVYSIKVDSSSSMFRITQCELTVKEGAMSAVMTMGGTGYLSLYMGTGEEALRASDSLYIPYEEREDGTHAFEIPVEALDKEISCSAFSKKKEKWYDRTLVFRADSLPTEAFVDGKKVTALSLMLEDGWYTAEVTLEGGSGRAAVESPARLRAEDGNIWATIVWGSSNYDYMKVDGQKFEPASPEGNSTFEIPVSYFDWKMPVIADTMAMSVPHEIEYTLTFDSQTLKKADSRDGKEIDHSMKLHYAEQFSVDYYKDGSALITIKDSGRYLVVPENGESPGDLPEDITVIQLPLENIYLAATSAMDLFRSLDGVKQITLSGTDASGWYIEEAKKAIQEGKMTYAGKYNAPDYELILSKSCDLAVESTMITHSPEVKEQLEKLGIPVLVERSSYESHPLGRMEWLKLYGVLLGKEDEAETLFEEQVKRLEGVTNQEAVGKTVAFFYISSNGYVNVRKPGDYVAKMIEMAGGDYIPGDLKENENALSTMNMQMEAFYAAAKDADYLIYNSTIDGELKSLNELLDKSSLLADFKAVKEGHVWCTEKNLFQETMGLGDMILDIHRILTQEDPRELTYLYPLR